MATSSVTLGYPSGTKLFSDTDNTGTAVGVASASSTIYEIEVDNSANAAASYTKLWNTASGGVTIGTTAPDMILYLAASASKVFVFPAGLVFGTAITLATVTTAGTAGTTNPTSDVIVRIVYA